MIVMEVRSCVWCVVVLCFAFGEAKYFKFEDCSKKDAIAQVSKFQMSPDPVNMKKNMTVDFSLQALRDVPEEAVLKTRYYKIKDVFGIKFDVPIPCILGRFGSCTIPLCEYLDLFKEQAEVLWPEDKEYGCPVTAGDYGGENIEIPMPYIPAIARVVVSGKYRTELKLLDKRGGKELACYKIWTEIR